MRIKSKKQAKLPNKKTLIRKLKGLTIQLSIANQIPFRLAHMVYKLNGDEDISYVVLLKDLTEDMMRIRGYYKKHRDVEKDMNDVIDNAVKLYQENNGHQ